MAWKKLALLLIATGLSQLQAQRSSSALQQQTKENNQQTVHEKKETANIMTNQAAWTLYEKYLEGWKAVSNEQRTKITAEVVAQDAQYTTPQHASGGRETMIEDMAAFQQKFPGGRFDLGDVSAHHDVALLTWVLVQANGEILVKGHDQIRLSPEGKIISLITFAPSVSKP